MRIIFVRHGHPNYEIDCLTELGNLQAQALAERLKDEPIKQFYASTCGRAMETAQWVAKKFDQEVVPLDFMREIACGSTNHEYELPFKGNVWETVVDMAYKGESLMSYNWQNEEPLLHNDKCRKNYDLIAENLDLLLKDLGYQREGDSYRVLRENHDTVLLASHGGASAVSFSHLLNLPFLFVVKSFYFNFTSISILLFHGKVGQLTTPDVECLNDFRHINGITVDKKDEN